MGWNEVLYFYLGFILNDPCLYSAVNLHDASELWWLYNVLWASQFWLNSTNRTTCNHQTHWTSCWSPCCIGNSQDNCYPIAAEGIDKATGLNYTGFSLVLFLLISGGCVVLHVMTCIHGAYKGHVQWPVLAPTAHAAAIKKEKRCALNTLGGDSVYKLVFAMTHGVGAPLLLC